MKVLEFAKTAFSALILFGLAIILFLKPSRILIPEMAGVACRAPNLCVEKDALRPTAEALYARAVVEVENMLGPFRQRPKAVFCSSTSCFKSFGFSRAAGQTIGRWGIVIGPRGWRPHYLRHELIHHWQAEQMGALDRWRAPEWLIEGMAYALSDDPRNDLGEPFQSYRSRFVQWQRSLDDRPLRVAIRQEF